MRGMSRLESMLGMRWHPKGTLITCSSEIQRLYCLQDSA